MRIFLMKNNEPLDFCYQCFSNEDDMENEYGELNGYEVEHPDYDDDEYYCHCCGGLLDGFLDE